MKTKKRLFVKLFGDLALDTAKGKTDFDFKGFTESKSISEVETACRIIYELAEKYPLMEDKNPFVKWYMYFNDIFREYYALPAICVKDKKFLWVFDCSNPLTN